MLRDAHYAWIMPLPLLGGCAGQQHRGSDVFVLKSDYGLAGGAIDAIHSVALTVDPELVLEDLAHQVPPYDTWAAVYRLRQAVGYFPASTVFVSVVDPGVGTSRGWVVARSAFSFLWTGATANIGMMTRGGSTAPPLASP